MKLVFCTPPPEQRTGGLDAAIDGLRSALSRRGIAVHDESAALEAGALVHFHGLWQPAHAPLARECAARGIPYLVSPHGMLEAWAWRHKWWKKWPYFHLVEKGHLARAQALLATAPAEARRLQKIFPRNRVEILPLGLTGGARPNYEDARRQLGWTPTDRVLLFLSRIHVKKGLDLLLRALASDPVPPDLRLIVVGDGAPAYTRTLQNFAEEHSAALPPIEWKGAVWGEQRWPYFQGADLFCLPTHSENFGLAILEACQVGTPVLTTVETPWAENLAHGRGFIGQPTVASVRQMLAEFFARPAWKPEQRRDLSEWAWAEYHWEVLAGKYAALYASLASSAP